MSAELKACPFCGGESVWHAGSDNTHWAGATCKLCGVTLDEQGAGCMDRAAASWNTRAAADALPGDGWVLVPREASIGMLDKLAEIRWPSEGMCPGHKAPCAMRAEYALKHYKAMIAAAPQPETSP